MLAELYFSCRDQSVWPSPGGYLEQTAFTMQLFNFCSDIVEKTRERQAKEAEKKR